jgi:hypothetical protein
MLDLGLEHLGVDVGAADANVATVLKACGESAHLDLFFLTHLHRLLQRFPGSKTRRPDVQRTKPLY